MMAAQSQAPAVSLAWLLREFVAGDHLAPVEITGLATDSRTVRPGDLFLAVRGLRTHGLLHAPEALQRGAAAVVWEASGDAELRRLAGSLAVPLVEMEGLGERLGPIADRYYAHPSARMHVIGVTGTDGKTSVTHFVAQALSTRTEGCGLLGTLGYGLYGALAAASHTTPDALRLQAEFAALRERGISRAVMEVSSHALHQHRTDGVAFHTAVLTHLSRDHLDYHGSVEAYAEAKRRLFLKPGLGCAVLNVGDAFGASLARELAGRIPVIAYHAGAGGSAREHRQWIELQRLEALETGLRLTLDSSWGAAELRAPLLGSFNAENLLAALGALLAAGQSLQDAVQRLSQAKTVPGRMELFSLPGSPRVVVDYAHTPHALESALLALRPHCAGELWCVFGAGGERDPGKRPLMGEAAERCADHVILTSDNPRGEPAQRIVDQISAGFAEPARARTILDRAAAIETAVRGAAPGDLVLVAGKGHEDYQQIGAVRRSFSDRVQVQSILRGLATC